MSARPAVGAVSEMGVAGPRGRAHFPASAGCTGPGSALARRDRGGEPGARSGWVPERRVCVSLSYTVDASEVTDLHVISYEVERDLVPLILSNCQYRVEQGQETLQEFDLEKIQRQVTGRFLQGKPRLTLKVRLYPPPAPPTGLVGPARLFCESWPCIPAVF